MHAYQNSVLGTTSYLYTVSQLPVYHSCAIVGSSGRLKHRGFGKEIDEHSFVIRFANAPLAGYEDDVGSFTSLRVINNEMLRGYVERGIVDEALISKLTLEGKLNPTKFLVKQAGLLPQFLTSFKPRGVISSDSIETPVLVLNTGELLPQVQAWIHSILGSSLPRKMNFTTGLYVIAAMTRHCEHIDLYGFGLVPGKCNHYYETDTDCVQAASALLNQSTTSHSYHEEALFFDKLRFHSSLCLRLRV